MRIVTMLGLLAALGAATAPSVAAQTCGDANDDDVVSVTDGVQALRAAASLPSTCSEGCDVDASGSITVTDGVNILRKAAGLSFPDLCQFTGEEANEVVQPAFGVFDAVHKLPGIGSGATAAGGPVCENDGSLDVQSIGGQSVASFGDCQIGGAILDGTISRIAFAQGIVVTFEDFTITRVKSGRSLTFSGQLAVGNAPNSKVLTGTLTVISEQRGTFTMRFTRVVILEADGSPRDGEVVLDLTNADGGTIEAIQILFTDEDELAARVRLRTGQVKPFILHRDTRLLRLPL